MKYILFITILIIGFSSFAQLHGEVKGSNNKESDHLPGAKLYFKNQEIGAITDEEGHFKFFKNPKFPDTMIVSAMGYYSDTILVTKADSKFELVITLYEDNLLPEVVIEAKALNSSILRLDPLYVEQLNSGELRKAACCNLSESFETNASVDVNITDAVSGAKKIQMMGLDGVYTQIQFENIPILKNLGTSFGLGMIPGTWINSIQITKGTGNVVNGYESMAGLINLEYQKPAETDRLFINAYGNIRGRMEFNFHNGIQLSERWSTAFLGHASTAQLEVDRNNDGFRDIPLSNNYTLMNRWKYNGPRFEAQFGIRGFFGQKFGGQVGFQRGDNSKYGVDIENRHFDAFLKTGFFFKEKPWASLGVVYAAKYHELSATFGDRVTNGVEKRGYVNLIYSDIIGTTDHTYKVGASFVYDDVNQTLDSAELVRTEIVPGVFGEYTFTRTRNTFVAGVRGDYHNLYGVFFSPRVHNKFRLTEDIDIRATAGRGYRVPNYISDNLSLLANNKAWIVSEELNPEISWNFGVSWVQSFNLGSKKVNWSVDFYHTMFENQMIVDRDINPNQIVFSNLNGRSYSNALQTDVRVDLLKNLELHLAYKFLDVKAEFGGELQQKIMIPRHRGFVNLGYTTRSKRWEYDVTASIFGKQRLPIMFLPSGNLTTENESEVYPMLSAQITHVYKRFDFYVGGENLLDYRQTDPIISAENFNSTTFDATRVWAPVAGINVYFGVRFAIEKKKELE